jgi:hypothetical protein
MPDGTLSTKPWWQSKVLWTNVAFAVLLGVQAWAGKAVIDPAIQAGIITATNAALRVFTYTALTSGSPQ